MTRVRRLALFTVLATLGCLAGLQRAHAHPWLYGDPHKCPAGASKASCFYPPNLGEQQVVYAINGALIGVAVTIALLLALRLFRTFAPRQIATAG